MPTQLTCYLPPWSHGMESRCRDIYKLNILFSISFTEANPDKFKSQLANQLFYAKSGGRDFIKRPSKDLTKQITLECDGVDYTSKIQELKLHCILFLNINK